MKQGKSKHANATSFQKGQSGNPGGRPKILHDVKEMARQHGKAALEKVVQLMGSDDERVALAAAQVVLDRAYGKPVQQVDVKDTRDVVDMTDAELAAIAAASSLRAAEEAESQARSAGVH